jgi:antitoxin CcdA
MSTACRSKKAVNVSISADLLQAARNGEINLSATLKAAVEHELRQLRKREWLEQNVNAIQAYNRDVDPEVRRERVPDAHAAGRWYPCPRAWSRRGRSGI